MMVKLARLSDRNKYEVHNQIEVFVGSMKLYSPVTFDEKKLRVELLLIHKGIITAMKDMKRHYSSDIDAELYDFLKEHVRNLRELFDFKLEERARFITMQESYIKFGFVGSPAEYSLTGNYWI
jgi:hypothetical protein